MSGQEVPDSSRTDTKTTSEQQSTRDATSHAETNSYCAPYVPHEKNRLPGAYLVQFHRRYTLTKHRAFLGRTFEAMPVHGGYGANMDDELFKAVRCDPGVKSIEDDVIGRRTQCHLHGITMPLGKDLSNLPSSEIDPNNYHAPYKPHEKARLPGAYLVRYRPGHTLEKHFEFLGRTFEVIDFQFGYGADLDDELFEAVRCDPGIFDIEDDVIGKRN